MDEEQARYLDPNDWSIGPCWNVRNCPTEWKNQCPVYEYQAGNACWEVGGTYCQGTLRTSQREKRKLCHQCNVFHSMLVEPKS